MQRRCPGLLVLACALATGCASTARLPTAFSLADASLVAEGAEALLVIDGPSGKGSGAGAGAAKGGSTGLLIGGLACMGAGPLAALCIAAVIPATTAIGAVGGAVAGAISTDSAANVEAKRALLASVMPAAASPDGLAARLQQGLHRRRSGESLQAGADGGLPRSAWTLRLGMTELQTLGAGAEAPYALRAVAQLQVLDTGSGSPVFAKAYQAVSPVRLRTAEWSANEALLARQAVEALYSSLAAQMATDLTGGHAARASASASLRAP